MENFSYRERLVLGYGSRRSLENSISLPPKSPRRVSDVDFSDVFGGPPRCSITEFRNSRSGSADSYSPRTVEDEKLPSSSTNPWSTLREKPIFGEESPSRRRLGGDFFDDIFKGDESLSSTPKRSDREPFSSVPSSRMHSPVHPSMSRQLSFSKVAKGIERSRSPIKTRDCAFSPLGIPSSPCGSRVGTQTIQWQDDAMFGPPTPNCQSPLSIHFSPRSDGTPKAIDSAGQSTQGHCVKGDNNKFHFSIYKWASKGAPLSMTFRGGNRVKSKLGSDIESKVCKSPEPVLQGVNMPYVGEKLSANRSFKSPFDNQNSISSKDFNINEGSVPTEAVKEGIYDIFTKNIEERGPRATLDSGESGASLEMNSSKTTKKKDRPKVKRNSFGWQEKLEMIPPAREKEGTLRITKNKSKGNDDTQEVKKQVGKKNTSNHTEVSTPSLRDEPIDSEEQIPQNRVKGKVKQFVKIFSQEASTKPTDSNDSPSLNFRKKDVSTSKVDKLSHANSCETLTDTAVLAKETLKQSEQAHSDINFSSYRSNDSPSERIDISTSFSGSIPGGFEFTPESLEESNSEDLHVNYVIENLPEDPEEQPQNDHLQEETQSLDAKILKWSKGKEGNIRSQLSTLQYVLGPESGWKPIPLVDIIEGASVKRAYQRALLCLHPDKLQQKGASAHQKYIAEKVFDILQEAWTHFGMLTSA